MHHLRLATPVAAALLLLACGDDASSSATGDGGAGATSGSGASVATTTAAGTPSSGGAGGQGTGGDPDTTSAGGGGAGGDPGAGGAGGGGAPPDRPWRSGSRLRAKVHDGGGDAVAFSSWFDVEIGAECRSTLDEELQRRCLPHGELRYLDADCTQPAVVQHPCDDDGTPFASGPVDGQDVDVCVEGSVQRVYRAEGEAFTVGQLYTGYVDGCQPNPAAERVVRAAVPADPADFVPMTTEVEPLGDDLSRAVERGADGSMRPIGGVDEARGVPCAVMDPPPADGSKVCLDTEYYLDIHDHYDDASCGNRAILAAFYECGPHPILRRTNLACGAQSSEVWERGEPIEPLFRVDDPDGCVDAGSDGFRYGPAIDPASLPQLDELLLVGDRVTRVATARDGVYLADAFTWIHDETGLECLSVRSVDGTHHCVPRGTPDVSDVRTFADAACTVPLVGRGSADECVLSPLIVETVEHPSASCPDLVARVWERGPAHRGPSFQRSTIDESCNEVTPDRDSPVLYALGAELGLDGVPLLDEVIE